MSGIEYGLGHFGDLRLEKGGPVCTLRWWIDQARASAVLEERGRARFDSRGSFAIRP